MNKAMRKFLCEQLAPNPESWASVVYKKTTCGAWMTAGQSSITIGSIVEGTDCEVAPVTLSWPFTPAKFWNTLEEIEDEADRIWHETHGCEGCAEKWMYVDHGGDPITGCDGMTPTHPDCPCCGGAGVVI